MKFKVGKSKLSGAISVPGSKSHTIRAVAIAMMADGVSQIRGALSSADTLSSVDAARAFGAEVAFDGDLWTVKGVGGKLRRPSGVVDLKNSGTSLRIFTGLAATADFSTTFDGDDSLRTRLMGSLLDALSQLGARHESANGKCPLTVSGPIRGGAATVDGKSSQFLTSLLFATPLAEGDTELKVVRLNEIPYVWISIGWLRRQGIEFEHAEDLSWFKIRGGQRYRAFDSVIPADFSTATFPLAAAAVCGGRVEILNLDFSDLQGDKEVFKYFASMGVKVEQGDGVTTVEGSDGLRGVEIEMNSTPDALPAMAAAAAFAKGRTVLRNVAQARIKETDRIACMTRELRKMGAVIEELEDGMVIEGGSLRGAEVDGCHDHRIVMALTIAGLAAEGETVVSTAEAAAVTYPNFADDFRKLGADIELIE